MNGNKKISDFIGRHENRLKLLSAMWADPRVQLYSDKKLPAPEELADGSVFLAGPTSRNQIVECNWRSEAVAYLREAGFSGYIYAPEPRGEEKRGDFTERSYIHRWESDRLLSASRPTFWIPRNSGELLGLNTNLELGIFIGKVLFTGQNPTVFIGWPDDAKRMGLPSHYAVEIAGCLRFKTLKSLCNAVAGKDELLGAA